MWCSSNFRCNSLQQQIRFPANALGAGAELLEGAILDLPDALLANAEQVADLPQAVSAVAGQAEAQVEDLALARPQVFHQEAQRLLALGALLERGALVVGHRLGQLEVAVVVKDGIEADGCARGGLKVREVLEAGAGAAGELLRAGQVLAAMGKCLGLLLQKAELLQVVRAEADQMALPRDGDLQGLADPPGRIGGQAGAMADVE